MDIATEEKDVERDQALGIAKNYCPFGCEQADIDELGYCQHLLGFTNDGKKVERVKRKLTKEGEDTGYRQVSYKDKDTVQKGDKLVNPEVPQINNGAITMAKMWVSARVYRPSASVSDSVVAQDATVVSQALPNELEEKFKAMQATIDDLKTKLADKPKRTMRRLRFNRKPKTAPAPEIQPTSST